MKFIAHVPTVYLIYKCEMWRKCRWKITIPQRFIYLCLVLCLVLKYSFFRKITIIFKVWPQEIPLQLSHLLSLVFTLGSLKLLVLKCTLFKPMVTAFGEPGDLLLTQPWLLSHFTLGTHILLLNNVWGKRLTRNLRCLNTDRRASVSMFVFSLLTFATFPP